MGPLPAWRLLWIVPILSAVVGLVLAVAALQTDDLILAENPCANSWSNPLARWMAIAFTIGIATSAGLLVVELIRKDRAAAITAGIAVVAGVLVFVIGMVLAGAGYGWHCPTM